MQENTEKTAAREEIRAEELNGAGVSLGLAPSDTADYDVNDGEDQSNGHDGGAAAERRGLTGAKSAAVFAGGFLCCLALVTVLAAVLGLGGILTKKGPAYYRELDAEYGKYYEIMKLIEEDPIAVSGPREIGDEELKEIVADTGDPYAQYYTAEEYEEFRKRYAGDYVGIGIAVSAEDAGIVIKNVFDDSPAKDAGLRNGDIIVKVDGKAPADVDEAVELISGEAGTKVTLTVERSGKTLEVETNRAKIDYDSVAYSTYEDEPGIGYINIAAFREGTADEFKAAVKDLRSEGCDRFIIDLRDNGGGLTDESIEIADYLLPEGRIMSEKKKDGSEKVYNSDASSAELDLVVLVNGNTASASEILTAALQDNKAGAVIGTKTYGKGVTQLSHRFRDGSAIKITTTEYFRPSGKTVNGVGITPDIEAEGEEITKAVLRELGK